VKVKVHAVSINPMDWRLLSGQARAVMELHVPAILGRDVSGDVLEDNRGPLMCYRVVPSELAS
jgi:NADPH:quinone reductase-like Zn-dependent oxidoreductase